MKRLLVLFITLAILAASFPPQAVAAQASCGRTYTVQKGDYLSKIARQCGVTTTALLQANPSISDWNLIYPGQVLNIPQPGDPLPSTVTGGSTYIVQPGDTLSRIARRFSVTVEAIQKANPSITNPNRIYSGQRIVLPSGAAQVPTVSITPVSGKAGSTITLAAVGFRPNIEVQILFGADENASEVIGTFSTDARGALLRSINVPSSAAADKSYVFVVRSTQNTSERAVSNPFSTGKSSQPSGTQTYVVQRGDYLRLIAAKFDTSVAAILIANPSITNPNRIDVGQRLSIPAGKKDAVVAVTPLSGAAGSQVYVVAGGFPANQNVDLELGLEGQSASVIVDGRTDSSGYVLKLMTIPSGARAGERWTARVRTTDLAAGTSAVSGVFTVK
ncbi:MAG TPA: LysM peptidoglycan-binding domain-containing protein [Chloroflexi bacterium]|nr:LysM peptidoglycan-binding domain-containing protein [Chloroflexota bacterium]